MGACKAELAVDVGASRTLRVLIRSIGHVSATVLCCLLTVSVISTVAAPAASGNSLVVAWGQGIYGQLGDGTMTNSEVPVPVSGLSGAKQLAGGAFYGLALLGNGSVMAWGENFVGELGDGNTTDTDVPVSVSGLSGVTAVAAGGNHSLALLSNGTVVAWGYNIGGELGDGTEKDMSSVPVPVSGLTGVTAIAAGQTFSMALLRNGTVMSWGYNDAGQLGDGTTIESDVPVPVSGLSGVKAIAAGGDHGMALLDNGTVMDWGSNDDGGLGDGTEGGLSSVPVKVSGLSGVEAIADDMALLEDGTVMDWGDNAEPGYLGDGMKGGNGLVPVEVTKLTEVIAIATGLENRLALLSNGTVMTWGDNLSDGTIESSDVPVRLAGLDEATAIAAGQYFSLAIGHIPPEHYYRDKTLMGSEPVPEISWGTLTLRSTENQVSCSVVIAGGLENPEGGGAGSGQTEAFNGYDCGNSECPAELGLHTELLAESLPWPSVLTTETTAVRQVTSGIKIDDECFEGGTELGSQQFAGSLQPRFSNGTGALHPSLIEYDLLSGELEGGGPTDELSNKTEGKLKVLGYEEQELITTKPG